MRALDPFGLAAHARAMTTTLLAEIVPGPSFDPSRMAVAAYLPHYQGHTRVHNESDLLTVSLRVRFRSKSLADPALLKRAVNPLRHPPGVLPSANTGRGRVKGQAEDGPHERDT